MKPVVLQLIDSFEQGGSERQAIQLTRLLCQSGHFNVRLASLSPDGSLRSSVADLDLGEVPSFPLNSFYDRNAVAQLRRLRRFLQREQIDILHTHDFYTNVFGMTAGSLARCAVRIASMRETAGMRTGAQKTAQGFAYSLSHQVVANSEAVREKLIAQGVRSDKISVLYNGLDVGRLATSASRPELLASLGLPPETGAPRKYVAIVANMRHEVKDYPTFLRAAQFVNQELPEVGFLLAGEGELTVDLQDMAHELGIRENTFFLGRCDAIGALLNVASVCVLSSKAEGFSNAILEYMAAGRPVVATDVGGAREAILEGETGYLVPSGDERKMAERIVHLLRSEAQARSMGEAGRRLVTEKFSTAAQLQKVEALYEELLTKSAGH